MPSGHRGTETFQMSELEKLRKEDKKLNTLLKHAVKLLKQSKSLLKAEKTATPKQSAKSTTKKTRRKA
jgi:hypothetical protein